MATAHPSCAAQLRERERAQSTIEFLGTIPLLMLAATALLQAGLLMLGIVCTQSAVGDLAHGEPRSAIVAHVPRAWHSRVSIEQPQGTPHQVSVRLAVPVLLPGHHAITIRATAQKLST